MSRNSSNVYHLDEFALTDEGKAPSASPRFLSRAEVLRELGRNESAIFVAATPTLRASVRGGAYAFQKSQEGRGKRFRCRRVMVKDDGQDVEAVEVERVA